MHTAFNNLPDTARLWIYQSSRPLTDAEVASLEAELQPAVNNWAAHGTPLLASAAVLHHRFILIAVDEQHHPPSGCSIDASVRWVRELGLALQTDFFDRSVAFVSADGVVHTLPLPQIKAAVADCQLTPETPIFNNLIATKGELVNWQVRAGDSWLKRYFKTQTV
ncbi:hypothetical protein [Tellurirhabdus rosea]|uniref:hypothetical protein n=1 Tax=Tellurirhabdus rosea TaxID=2674997 RepID=UPI00225AF994|nr:hypothetical protein [Tellurirhabdus rosea]